MGAAIYKAGDIFLSTFDSSPSLFQYDGETHNLLRTYGGSGYSGVYTDSHGYLWVLHTVGKSLEVWNADGTTKWTASMPDSPESCAFSEDHAWVGCINYDPYGPVPTAPLRQYSLKDGTFLGALSPTISRGCDHLAMMADGHTLLYTSETSTIYRYDTSSGQGPDFAAVSGATTLYGLAVLADGTIAVGDGNGKCHHVATNGATLGTFSIPNNQGLLFGCSAEPSGEFFWVAGISPSTPGGSSGLLGAWRVSLATGGVVGSISSGVTGSRGCIVNVVKSAPIPRQPFLKVSLRT